MKTSTLSLTTSGLFFFVAFISVSWIGLSGLEAQTFDNTPTESPVEFSPFYAGGIDLGLENHGHPLLKGRGNYMASLDTLKEFTPRDGELGLNWIAAFEFNENHRMASRDYFFYSRDFEEVIPINSLVLTYDQAGVLVVDTMYSFPAYEEEWRPTNYKVYEYNQEGIWIRTTEWTWNLIAEEWRPLVLFEREFENGLRVKESEFWWNRGKQEFELENYTTWEYADELLVNEVEYQKLLTGDTFNVYQRSYFEYNNDRLLSVREDYKWQNGELRPVSRLEGFYNDDNLLNLQYLYTTLLPDIDNVEWIPDQKTETSYTDFGRKDITIVSDWNKALDEWIPAQRSERSYTDFGKTDIILVYDWNIVLEEWEPNKRTQITYDGNENLTDKHFSYPNPDNPDQWLLDRHSEYEYDYNFDSGTYLTVPFSIVDVNGHMLTKLNISLLNPTRVGSRTELIYSELTVNTEEPHEEDGFHLFPNPVKDMLSIRLEKEIANDQKITVVDLTGRILYRNHFNGSLEISTDQWPSGIYSVVLQDLSGAPIISRQFVKQ